MGTMRKQIIIIIALCMVSGQSFAAQQQKRTYQKQNIIYQNRKQNFQKQEFPNAGAYIKVSRKKPTINVEIIKTPQIYNQNQEIITCSSQQQAIGCTHYATQWAVQTNCDDSEITLKIAETKKIIDITSRYKANSCSFDVVLKHELTHQSLNEKVLTKVIGEASKQILSAYEQMQKSSRSCEKIKEAVVKTVNEYNSKFAAEIDKQSQLIDKDDANLYQFQQCENMN